MSDTALKSAGLSSAQIAAALSGPNLGPLVVDITSDDRSGYTFSNLQDVVLVQTGTEVRDRLYVFGGEDVTVLGADIRPTSHAVSSALYLKDTASSITVEGVYIDNSAAGEHDGIVVNGGDFTPNVTISASQVLNVQGSYTGFHGDVFQSQGGLGTLTISDFVGTTNYQGIFLGDAKDFKAPSSITMKDVYLGYADGPNKYPVLLWLGNGSAEFDANLVNVVLDEKAASRGSDFASRIYAGQDRLSGILAGDSVNFTAPTISADLSFGSVAKATNVAAEAAYDWKAGLAKSLGVDQIVWGSDAKDVLQAASGSAGLFGGAGSDTLVGGNGNDYLSGGLGSDVMKGARGNDTYVVDNSWDRIVEWQDGGRGGIDTVLSSISYRLGANLENLQLTGSGALKGWGNGEDNILVGGLGNNALYGESGNDKLYGGEGNDLLDGGWGDDLLDGGIGVDVMSGHIGNDTYVVDNVGDVVIEYQGAGTDTVLASIDYTLGHNVENLVLTGTEALSGTGNRDDNVIVGNDGANTLSGMVGNDSLYGGAGNDTLDGGWGDDLLDGGTGDDLMIGGDGNDTYVVDSAGDRIVEWGNGGKGGVDTVLSSIDYTVPINVENLELTGSADLAGRGNSAANGLKGNAGANLLWGGAGNDTIDGGAGADELWGGDGEDVFVFRAGEAQGDHIMDFEAGDKISFEGYGAGAYATFADHALTIHYAGGTETIAIDGDPLTEKDWSFSAIAGHPDYGAAAGIHAGW